MADNILKGIIKLEAQGVVQTTSQVASALTKTEGAFKATKNAGFAFNQILREAPAFAFSFQTGIIGISNNLPILTDALNRAREAGAGTGEILKSLAENLVSLPSILSIGALALTVFAGSSRKSKEETEALNKEAEAAKAKQEEFKRALDSASQSVLSQASNLSDLRNILVSTSSQVQGLTQDIKNQAIAQFLFDKKNVEVQRILNNEIQRGLALAKQRSPILTLKSFQNPTKDKFLNDIKDAEDGLRVLNETAKALGITFDGILPSKPVKELKIKPNKITVERPELGSIQIQLPTVFDVLSEDNRSRFQKQIQEISKSINASIPITIDLSKPGKSFQSLSAKNAAVLAAIRKPAEDLGKAFSEAFRGAATGGIESFAEGVGNVLSGKSFGAGIVGVIGDLLQQLGKALIAYGVIKSGLDKLLGPGGILIPGGVALALGAVAIAAGQAFKNFGGARAKGGPVSAGKAYLVGENGPEIFNPGTNGSIIPNHRLSSYSGGGSMSGRVVFEISGNKLRGILKRADMSALGLE